MIIPDLGDAVCDALRTALHRGRFTVDGVAGLLGPAARAALDRGEPEPAARAVAGAGDAGTLVRLFLLGEAVAAGDAATALAPLAVDDAVASGLLRRDPDGAGAGVRAALDLRPHADDAGDEDGDGAGPWWVLSDLEDDRDRDHVLGTGAASLSLARATVRRPVGTLLDLGTGSGVQLLHAARHADHLTGTDIAPRALALGRATLRLSGVRADLLEGAWWRPVDGRRFDQVVANPPFVPGPPEVELVYRDSGLGGDGASALLVATLPGHLAEGGVGQLLASWLVRAGGEWSDRPRQWLEEAARAALPGGLDAWVVQREVTDTALHVGTWLTDAGTDPASPQGRERSARWLDHFAADGVVGIGFGFVTLRRTAPGVPGTVVCEDLRQALADPLGPEVEAWLDRTAWLATHDLLAARLRVPDSVALERGLVGTDEGWARVAGTLVRLDGPQWRHDVDELGEALLAGCRGHLPLADLLGLLALAHDRDEDELTAAALPVVRDLVRHGMLVPG